MTPTKRLHLAVRSAHEGDRHKLATLIHFSPYVHRHLDWRSPLDWLGKEPYLVAESSDQILAALACPPETPDLTWVRLFAVSSSLTVDDAWESLWPVAHRLLGADSVVAALPLQPWFRRMLASSLFSHTHDVVMLRWDDCGQQLAELPKQRQYCIRMMNVDDLDAVHSLDVAAFNPVWQHSAEMLRIAFQGAALATVAEDRNGIIAYQVSTANSSDGHLARFAVHPRTQRLGVGYMLLQDLLKNFRQRGIRRVTVNTQMDNGASLSLYEKAGFYQTGEAYPIYEFN